MEDFIHGEIYKYFKGLGYSDEQAKRIADGYTDSVFDALMIQIDTECDFIAQNIIPSDYLPKG